MKPSCTKVKNPCKVCLQQVSNKNGLQCQGACQKWAHYKCLSYTPGKISDIKAGIIKVTCPCPDCETTQPKEFLVNPPYTCSNHQCPANKTPKCQSFECPTNKPKSQPKGPVPVMDFSPLQCTNEAVPCPATECQNQRLNQHQQRRSHPRMSPPRPPTPPRIGTPKGKFSPRTSPKPKSKTPPACPNIVNARCPGQTRSPLQKSPSCSLPSSNASQCNNNPISSSSDSIIRPKGHASLVQALQEVCTTVGKLSVQLKELMCKIMQT